MLNTPVTSQMSTNFTHPPHFFYKLLVCTISGTCRPLNLSCQLADLDLNVNYRIGSGDALLTYGGCLTEQVDG